MTGFFHTQAERLRLASIREQYKINDRARRLGVKPRILPSSLTASQLARRAAKNASFAFRYGDIHFQGEPFSEEMVAGVLEKWRKCFNGAMP